MDDKKNIMQKYFIDNFGEYGIEIVNYPFEKEGMKYVHLNKDGIKKAIYYSDELERVTTNMFDGIYFIKLPVGNAFTVHSYQVGNELRVFLALTNIDHGIVYSVGYDLNNKEYFNFPLNENGLIDDNLMKEMVQREDSLRIDKDVYNNSHKLINLFYLMDYFGIKNGIEVCDNLVLYNKEKIDVLGRKTFDRICNKRFIKVINQ